MRVDPTHWGPHSCEELLCGCCDGVVYESNPPIKRQTAQTRAKVAKRCVLVFSI
jgi:hypothetical protein